MPAGRRMLKVSISDRICRTRRGSFLNHRDPTPLIAGGLAEAVPDVIVTVEGHAETARARVNLALGIAAQRGGGLSSRCR